MTVRMMKKWWLIALVITLALSLTSCGKRKPVQPQGSDYGLEYCDGDLGSFDIYVFPSSSPGLYEVSIIPVSVADPGLVARVNIANQSRDYRELVHEVVLEPEHEIAGILLTDSDLQTYNIIAITQFEEGGVSFLNGSGEGANFCYLPMPGVEAMDNYGSATRE